MTLRVDDARPTVSQGGDIVADALRSLAEGTMPEEATWKTHIAGESGLPQGLFDAAEKPSSQATLDVLQRNRELWPIDLPFL